jgi:flagellar protein FliS
MTVARAEFLQNYKRTEIETATPAKLLLMLYDAAIQRLESAGENFRLGEWESVHKDLIRVQDILTELMVSLDWEAPGAPTPQLFSLYSYMHQSLVRANVERDSEPITEVMGLLSELREAWREAVKKVESDEGQASQPQRPTLDLHG